MFGLEVVPTEANRQALLAAVQLDARLAALHAQLERELGCATGHVVHLHTGMAAVGETGDRLTRTLTAAGSAIDVVWQLAANTAQREGAPDDACIVVSRPVWVAAQRDVQAVVWHELDLTGGARVEIARLDSAHLTGTVQSDPALQ